MVKGTRSDFVRLCVSDTQHRQQDFPRFEEHVFEPFFMRLRKSARALDWVFGNVRGFAKQSGGHTLLQYHR